MEEYNALGLCINSTMGCYITNGINLIMFILAVILVIVFSFVLVKYLGLFIVRKMKGEIIT